MIGKVGCNPSCVLWTCFRVSFWLHMARMSLQQRVWHLNWLNATTVTPVLSLSMSCSTLSSLVSMTDKTSLHLRWKHILKLKGAVLLLLSCTGHSLGWLNFRFLAGPQSQSARCKFKRLSTWVIYWSICLSCLCIYSSFPLLTAAPVSHCEGIFGCSWLSILFPCLGWGSLRFLDSYHIVKLSWRQNCVKHIKHPIDHIGKNVKRWRRFYPFHHRLSSTQSKIKWGIQDIINIWVSPNGKA